MRVALLWVACWGVLACSLNAFAAEVPTELQTVRGVEGHATGLDDKQPKDWERHDPSNIIRYEGRYLLWVTEHPRNNGFTGNRIIMLSSADGKDWRFEQVAFEKNPDRAWDDAGVLTAYVVPHGGRYYLFYTGVDKSFKNASIGKHDMGYAVADSPFGPWVRPANNRILLTGPEGAFDELCVDDANILRWDGKWYFYYKGRTAGDTASDSQIGLAVSDHLTGPYVKHESNPLFKGHAFSVTKYKDGLVALPGSNHRNVLWSTDGLRFKQGAELKHKSTGMFNPANFKDGLGEDRIDWVINVIAGFPRKLHRIDLVYE
ncbi:MAG: family 43 glycosylhydrolase [Planctomycetota bacterium]|jgi:hypothetical protein